MQNIVLLHGALGLAEDLEPLAESLRKSELNVYSFSFSGHGTIGFKDEFGITQFVDELEEFVLEKKLKNVTLFGYSMGGYVALCFALRETDLIDKIITLGTKFNWVKDIVEKETRLLDPEIMLEKIPAYAKSLETKHGEHWKKLVLKTAGTMREIGDKNFLNQQTLQTINKRVLIGLADKDAMVTFEETIKVYKTLPKASMFMLPATKHPIETVNITLLTKLIVDFMRIH